ncbi:sigma-54 interaction domain-containing protein [Desulfovirgula thermocuniculi]|uniref:sigma-54 interaction domain-containing protein n=1 Tax=Desulfovirgula thermocuniculi TaxID=348842 RepID=UPI0006880F6E|nr:sigma-54-dependent Fis family transcriptional regulator [Desulfovirgula thermocuniculi]
MNRSGLAAVLEERLGTALYCTDGEAYTLGVNKAYEELTGLRGEELCGQHMRELVEKSYFDRSVTLMVLEEGRSVTIGQKIIRTGREVLVTGNPVRDDEGKIILVVTTVKPYRPGRRQVDLPAAAARGIEVPGVGPVIAESEAMKQVIGRAIRAAASEATVLLYGESGVGKEVVARLIHEYSRRKTKPFVAVNAAAIPGELFEAEMFGYRPGAFTGARREGRAGLVKAAEGGTLFLDEVGEIPLWAQAKLLRLLQNKEYYPLGSSRPERADVRIVAATNQDLYRLVQEGRFRKDLYYRLNVIQIRIPPLATRKEDIMPLAEHFLGLYATRYEIPKELSGEAERELLRYHWPGNVRELQNLMERLVVLAPEKEISAATVQRELEESGEALPAAGQEDGWPQNLERAVEEFEKSLIRRALQKYPTQEEAARALGIHRSTLARKIKRYFS